MFQRLKGAIDSRIAEEQARSRLSQSSPSRSNSNSRRTASRALSPTRRSSQPGARGRQDGDPSAKELDPASFDPDLEIEGGELSRSRTPGPTTDQNGSGTSIKGMHDSSLREIGQEISSKASMEDATGASSDLPTDVRVRLRKLEKLESKYHELLKSYRIAHAKVLTIEPFEKSLRESTPLTSINDPNAFVEYLNQVNLKGDMVLDELKRVSSERDTFKQKLSEAEIATKEAWDQVANLRELKELNGEIENAKEQNDDSWSDGGAAKHDLKDERHLETTVKSPLSSIKSPTASIRASLFSTKSNLVESPKIRQSSEDSFPYDGEIPRLETEIDGRQRKINELEIDVKNLKKDLTVARESTQSMVQTLEEATRELNSMREVKYRSESDTKKLHLSEDLSERLRKDLDAAERELLELRIEKSAPSSSRVNELDEQLTDTRAELESAKSAENEKFNAISQVEGLEHTIAKMESEMTEIRSEAKKSEKKVDTLSSLVATLKAQLKEAEENNQDFHIVIEKASKNLEDLQEKVVKFETNPKAQDHLGSNEQSKGNREEALAQRSQSTNNNSLNPQNVTNSSKKKSKKRKKGAKSSGEHDAEHQSEPKQGPNGTIGGLAEFEGANSIAELQEELRRLRIALDEKDAAIDRMQGKMGDQEGLREEIDNLRDDLVNVGQEHVEAKDRIKGLLADKNALDAKIDFLEKELAELRVTYESRIAGSDRKLNDFTDQFENSKSKATVLEADLSAAQQLASSRFKDLNDLRNALQKAQPEINALRGEAAEMKSVKETLGRKEAEFSQLASKHEDTCTEVMSLKGAVADQEARIKNLHQNLKQEISNRLMLENANSKASQELQRLEVEKRQTTDSFDRFSKELTKAREGLANSKARLTSIEQQLSKTRSDNESLKEEIELKSAQYASAQSLMASMRDQTAEMAMQMKEARERCESLDEEVADAHRLMSERSREGETLRRLLADVEGRADARTREMKERMDTAIEERDRAEDEASTAGRRRARELEDMKNRYRDVERNLKRAEEDKEELEIAQRDWKRRREELEYRVGQSTKEFDEVRKAMGELQDALDESERQARELEKQKAELHRSVEESQHRLEKLQKSNKSMTEEISRIQKGKSKTIDSEAPSSRTSLDSAARLGSPALKSSNRQASTALVDAPNGQAPGTMDYVYLKNVLLQFVEQKDKKHQVQLVPVLGMLLHFDRKDEQRWMSAITAK